MKFLTIYKNYIHNRIFKKKTDKQWSSFEYFNPKWRKRVKSMSLHIRDSDKSILDLGCGKMWLKEYIKKGMKYYGCDYVSRGDNTIICDFNLYEFPSITVDVIFISGLAEYIKDLNWFFERIGNSSNSIIISYCTTETNNNLELRKKQGWKNHLKSDELIALIKANGFELSELSNQIKGNQIYRFDKSKLNKIF